MTGTSTGTNRGERTRARLLDAATRMFSERGFEGVSTRELASAAKTTLPSIAHHFGSKQGLYEAVLLTIASGMATQLEPALVAASDALSKTRLTRAQALSALELLLGAHARAMLGGRPDWTALVVREQLRRTPVVASPDGLFERRLLAPVMGLIGFLRGLPPESEEVKLQALMLAGRAIAFRALRRSSLQMMGWPKLSNAEVDRIAAALGDELHAIFAKPGRRRV